MEYIYIYIFLHNDCRILHNPTEKNSQIQGTTFVRTPAIMHTFFVFKGEFRQTDKGKKGNA